nr:zeta toxin family protein [Vibrio anguillarum]
MSFQEEQITEKAIKEAKKLKKKLAKEMVDH